MKKQRGPTPRARWEPLQRTAGYEGAPDAMFAKHGLSLPDEVWGSNLFTCTVRYGEAHGVKQGRDGLMWLSIHRRDRKPIRDCRHMQSIKNEVAGPDRVAVEVYPAEADLVDTSNEYHLWVFPAGTALPFGFTAGGLVMDVDEVAAANERDAEYGAGRAVQRAWQPGLSTGPPATEGAS